MASALPRLQKGWRERLKRTLSVPGLWTLTRFQPSFPKPSGHLSMHSAFQACFSLLGASHCMSFGSPHLAYLPHLGCKPCLASPCTWLSHALITTQALSPCRSRGLGDPTFRHHSTC